ncbi:hypothetical protein N7499_009982 [Penicillium canescens]|uniref:Mid2 domain-containing protein n=1 Tax=Penicillium canescens TaxID=5083 RepID=A0AAD6NE39_PENCN|nr:uncharacterized protein N7446_008000 [Penicillium canescens]KAJ6018836.1 hypothetical protein N7522_000903 [Penicillium canescens]KAJ6033706.1 hypothetical protein N7444_011477 [Penicillium canescens]KAJ6057101.1 hypothetical protein N7460_000375 [Penicillium canescens]KAJ6058417.1 hypothetical protein N7446_008000 [Penicillium canescens]KAJ6071968.1 hypothetical protein N7499_009982 [Penicillium canescens]
MRLSSLSFIVHALLLTAVAAQSGGVSDILNLTSETSSSSSAEPTSTSSSSTSTSSTSTEPTTTSEPTTSSTSSTSTTPSAEPTTAADPTTSSSSSSSTSSTSSNNEAATTSAGSSTTEPPSTTQTPVVKTITSYETRSGSTVANVMTTTSTPVSDATSPSLNGDKSSGSSGVSSSDKKIIIGVVVGVGGAILIGALGLVFWRIHKKRNEQFGDEDDLMGGTAVGSGPREKAPSPAGNTPFKNTLDQYHNPGPVNAASNF